MTKNALMWVILLTVFIAIGLASLSFYLYMDEVIKGFFIS